jgi:hypothetical protein
MSKVHSLPAGTLTQALTSAGIPPNAQVDTQAQPETNHGVAFFDIQEMLATDLPHPLMHARTLSSMAWSIDTTILNVARGLFFKAHKESMETNHVDNFNDFISLMSEMRANENYVEDLGFALESSSVQELCTLLSLSQRWHELADDSCRNAKIKYSPKSFEELLKAERPQAIDQLTERKIKALVALTMEGSGSTADELTEFETMVMNQRRAQFESMHETRQKIIPAVLRLIDYAKYHSHGDSTEFWQLSLESQVRLISSTRKTIDRVLTDLSSYRSITELEFIGMIREAKAVAKQLDNVLNTGKFATH